MAYYGGKNYGRLENYGRAGRETRVDPEKFALTQDIFEASQEPENYQDAKGREIYRLKRQKYKGGHDRNNVYYGTYHQRILDGDTLFVDKKRHYHQVNFSQETDDMYNRAVAQILENLTVTAINQEGWLGDMLRPDGTFYTKKDQQGQVAPPADLDPLSLAKAFRTDTYDDYANGADCLVVTGRQENGEFLAFSIDATMNAGYKWLCEKKFYHLDGINKGNEFGFINYFMPSDFTEKLDDDQGQFIGLTNVPRFIISLNPDQVNRLGHAKYIEQAGQPAPALAAKRESSLMSHQMGQLVLFELYTQAYMMDKILQNVRAHRSEDAANPDSQVNRALEKNAALLAYFREAIIKKARRDLRFGRQGVGDRLRERRLGAESSDADILLGALETVSADSKADGVLGAFYIQMCRMIGADNVDSLIHDQRVEYNPDRVTVHETEPINVMAIIKDRIDMDLYSDRLIDSTPLAPYEVKGHRPADRISQRGAEYHKEFVYVPSSQRNDTTPERTTHFPVETAEPDPRDEKLAEYFVSSVEKAIKRIKKLHKQDTEPGAPAIVALTPEQREDFIASIPKMAPDVKIEWQDHVHKAIQQYTRRHELLLHPEKAAQPEENKQYTAEQEEAALKHFQVEYLEDLFLRLEV